MISACQHFRISALLRELLANSRRFFAFEPAQIIQFCATRFAFGFDLDLGDARRVRRKNAFDPFAIRNSANGECFVYAATFATDHYPGEDLDSFLISLDHASMHPDAVANFELAGVFQLLFFNKIDDAIHKRAPWEGKGVHFATNPGNCNLGLFSDLTIQ